VKERICRRDEVCLRDLRVFELEHLGQFGMTLVAQRWCEAAIIHLLLALPDKPWL
jgi:hypothetical protein